MIKAFCDRCKEELGPEGICAEVGHTLRTNRAYSRSVMMMGECDRCGRVYPVQNPFADGHIKGEQERL